MTQLAPIDRRAATWGVLGVLVAIAIAVLGSGNLRWFDAALVGYLFGTLFATFAVIYRYMIWLQRPPTARLNRRGWEAFRSPGRRGRNALALPGLVLSNLLAQSFIRGRSRIRWLGHQLVFWGCVLAALVTFPLVFGLLHFESVGQNGREYKAFVGEIGTLSFDSRSVLGWVCSTFSTSPRCWCWRACSCSWPAACATPGRWPPSGPTTSWRWPGCSRCR
jgi:hypothetical protein